MLKQEGQLCGVVPVESASVALRSLLHNANECEPCSCLSLPNRTLKVLRGTGASLRYIFRQALWESPRWELPYSIALSSSIFRVPYCKSHATDILLSPPSTAEFRTLFHVAQEVFSFKISCAHSHTYWGLPEKRAFRSECVCAFSSNEASRRERQDEHL